MKLDSGHEIVPFSAEMSKMTKLRKDFPGLKEDVVKLKPGNWVLPGKYTKFANRIYNFELRKSDVIVLTYPKCGTTWTQEIIWTMRNNPNFNHPWASRSLTSRSPFLDFDMYRPPPKYDASKPKNPVFETFLELCPGLNPDDGCNLLLAEAIPDPRTIKTHLPFSLMPPSMLDTTKVVFVARNPKDLIVSYHHHNKIDEVISYVGSFENYVQYFVDDNLIYGPYWRFLKEAWERKDHPNLHIIFYEDLKSNPLEELKKLDVFLDTHLTEEQLKAIISYSSFSEMKARGDKLKEEMSKGVVPPTELSEDMKKKKEYLQKEGGFFRKGEVGDWKNKFTPELELKVDQWVQSNLNDLGVNFRYGI